MIQVGDRVMVLKRDEKVGERAIAQASEKEVLELIVSGAPQAKGEMSRGEALVTAAS